MCCRLPSETEWEFAARHPHIGWAETPKLYPWGDEAPSNDTAWRLNLWQGDFPKSDAALDGYAGLAPADAFEPNAAGLHNMLGGHPFPYPARPRGPARASRAHAPCARAVRTRRAHAP